MAKIQKNFVAGRMNKSIEREEYSQCRCDREGDPSAERFPQRFGL